MTARKRERKIERMRDTESVRKGRYSKKEKRRERVVKWIEGRECVCSCVWEIKSDCVRESVCVCVCVCVIYIVWVCERERNAERKCV